MALFDLVKIKATIDKLESEQNEPNFWNDQKRAVKVVNELNNNKDIYTSFNNICYFFFTVFLFNPNFCANSN